MVILEEIDEVRGKPQDRMPRPPRTPNPAETENFMQLVASPQDYLKFRLNANLAGQPLKPAEAAWPEKNAHERNLLKIAAKDVT